MSRPTAEAASRTAVARGFGPLWPCGLWCGGRFAWMGPILLMAALAGCGEATAGSGDPEFDVRRIYVGHPSTSVLVFDRDQDGVRDILVLGGGRLTVLRGDGSGEFAPDQVVDAGEHPVHLAVGDLDQDGWPDLVIANHETSYLTLLFGGPEGFGVGRSERLSVDVSPHPHAVAVADLDEDGHLDIVVDDRDRDRLAVYRGDGRGSFEPGEPIPVGGDPYRGMTLADLDDDGHIDVITPNPRAVAVQFGDGTGAFSPGPLLDSSDMSPFSTTVGDFNGDGILDVAAGSGEGPGGVTIWLGKGDGLFERAPNTPYRVARGPTRLNTADVNGDGLDDVLVTSYLGNEVAVLLGSRDTPRVVRVALDDHPWDVAAGDLNGNGQVDLVTAHDGGDYIAVLLARTGGHPNIERSRIGSVPWLDLPIRLTGRVDLEELDRRPTHFDECDLDSGGWAVRRDDHLVALQRLFQIVDLERNMGHRLNQVGIRRVIPVSLQLDPEGIVGVVAHGHLEMRQVDLTLEPLSGRNPDVMESHLPRPCGEWHLVRLAFSRNDELGASQAQAPIPGKGRRPIPLPVRPRALRSVKAGFGPVSWPGSCRNAGFRVIVCPRFRPSRTGSWTGRPRGTW